MKLSIVITTRNRKKDLSECVESLSNSSVTDFEIIIVDDCSSDGTEYLAKKDFTFKKLSIFHLQKQQMMIGARNFGAKKAVGEWIMFVDDDNIVDKDLVENMLFCCRRNPSYGVIGVPVYFYADKLKHFSAQKFSFYSGAVKTIIEDKSMAGVLASDGTPNIFMTRKAILEKTNYFDPSLVQTLTDVDFAFVVKKMGFKCGVCQKAVTYHKVKQEDNLKPRSMGGVFSQKSYCLIRNRMVVVKRYGSLVQKVIFLIFFCWSWPIIYSLLALKNKRNDLVKAYWYGFKDGLIYFLSGRLINSLPELSPR